jgi:hypothetical protein
MARGQGALPWRQWTLRSAAGLASVLRADNSSVFDVGGRESTTVSCPDLSAEGDEEMPKIKKAGGISRFLDAVFYRNSVTENGRSFE